MRRTVIALLAMFAALLSSAHAADQPATTGARALVQKVRRGVMKVQVADVRTAEHDIDWGGGSGFLFEIDYDKGIAYMITNHHVAGHASYVSATAWNGQVYNGELVRSEPGIDIALVRLHGIPDERNLPDDQKTLMPEILGDSDKVQIGELATAMGAPGAQDRTGVGADRSSPFNDFLMSQTATQNVVTGRESPLQFELEEWMNGRNGGGDEQEVMGYQYATNLDFVFRMSTAINGGNSGGPLFNKNGEVIAINTWGGQASFMQNGNLSVPINFAKDFAYQILNNGKFEKPWAGIDILFPPTLFSSSMNGNADPLQAYFEFRDKDRPAQLEVFGVRHDSPADKAGLKRGDIILDINGQKFKLPEDVRHWMFTQDIGTDLSLRILRGGKLMPDPIKIKITPKRSYDSDFSV